MAPILPFAPISLPRAMNAPALGAAAPATGFQHVLESALSHVAHSSATANKAVSDYMSGGTQELHSTVLATQNASLDFEMLLQVRNKVVSAYEEVMKMQI